MRGEMGLTALVLVCSVCFVYGCTAMHEPFAPNQLHNALQQWNTQSAVVALQNDVQLLVNESTFFPNGQWVEVSWTGVDFPSLDDMVALYVPADAHPAQTAPAKFMLAAKADRHMRTGAGTVRFRLINMRAPMRFAFVRNGLDSPRIVATSSIIRVADPNTPTGVHLALTGKAGEMLAQWVSRDAGSPIVQWGTLPGQYSKIAQGRTLRYTRADMCGGWANSSGWVDPGHLQQALMTDLQPNTVYYYRCGDQDLGFSDEKQFLTPPAVGPNSGVKFFALADMGQAEVDGSNEMTEMIDSLKTVQLMQQDMEGRSLIIHNGDISYSLGFVTSWDAYFDQLEPLASSMAYMTCIGNHERDFPNTGDRFDGSSIPVADSGGECGIPYERRLQMPRPAEDKPWYTFQYGPITFIQYSTEHPFEPGTEQHRFVEEALKSVDRSVTPWLIVGGHRPFYIDSLWERPPDGDQDVARQLRASFEDLFLKYNVDMTWHGHHHSYQRTCPVYNGTCVQQNADGSNAAPVHLVIGHAGAGLCFNVHPEQPDVFDFVAVEHGFMKVQANGTHLHCQAIRNADGGVMDEFWLRRPLQSRQMESFAAQ